MRSLLTFNIVVSLALWACQPVDTRTPSSYDGVPFSLAADKLPGYEAEIDHRELIGHPDEETYFRGMKTYIAQCFSCHGNQAHEGSLPTANKFWQDTFKVGTDPYSMYQAITRGIGLMPPQIQLTPREKYDVIHYLREEFLAEDNPEQYVEIGSDEDHVHFLIQSVPVMQPKQIVQITKSITAREICRRHPEVKQKLWGGKFWTSGYYMNTVGQYANEEVIKKYVEGQGMDYRQVYRGQLELFDGI